MSRADHQAEQQPLGQGRRRRFGEPLGGAEGDRGGFRIIVANQSDVARREGVQHRRFCLLRDGGSGLEMTASPRSILPIG